MTWNGCVTDRGDKTTPSSSDYDRKITAPSTSIKSSLWPAEQYGSCPEPMMGLTYDWDALNGLVDKLEPDGMTNQPIGLVWAWQSLVGGGPLTAPAKTSGYNYKEIIVLMSDGLNTQNRWTQKPIAKPTSKKRSTSACTSMPRRAPARTPRHRHHHLHRAREHRRRSEIDAARELRERHATSSG